MLHVIANHACCTLYIIVNRFVYNRIENMSSLSATQSDGYYLPPEYFESGAYLKQSRNQFAASRNNTNKNNDNNRQQIKTGHNQWLKYGVVRFELPEKVRKSEVSSNWENYFSCHPTCTCQFGLFLSHTTAYPGRY